MRSGAKSGENCSLDEFGSGDEFGSVDLLASVGLNTRDLEAAVGANHRKSVGVDGNDLAKLPADALWVLGRQRLGVEDLESRAAQRSPGTGRGVAAADKAIDLLPRLAPIDLRVAGAAATFVSRLRLVLLDAWRLAGLHQIDRFHHRFDAHREKAVEIDGTECVRIGDRCFLLNQDVAGI